jgi:hypothetical protein
MQEPTVRNDSLFIDVDTENLTFLVYTNDAIGRRETPHEEGFASS